MFQHEITTVPENLVPLEFFFLMIDLSVITRVIREFKRCLTQQQKERFVSPPASRMVFGNINLDMKERALSLYFQGHLPKDICHVFGFSEKGVRR